MEKKLIVTADDFGMASFIDQGILRAVENGCVNTVSAMMNFPGVSPKIIALKRQHPWISVGIHLNLSAGKPLSSPLEVASLLDKDACFYHVGDLFSRLYHLDIQEVRCELEAQVNAFYQIGLVPDHISYHQNVFTLFPAFWDLVVEIAQSRNIPLRSPVPHSLLDPSTFGYASTRKRGKEVGRYAFFKRPVSTLRLVKHILPKAQKKTLALLQEHKLRAPGACIDAYYGDASPKNLRYILENLPNGISELLVHPGERFMGGYLPKGINPDYIHPRFQELETLLTVSLPTWMEELGIKWATYKECLPVNHFSNSPKSSSVSDL